MLNEIIGWLVMIFTLLLIIAFISGLTSFFYTSIKCGLRYNTRYLCQALVDFPVPREFRKLKWWPWKYWYCYLRQQDNKRFRLFFALPVEGGLLIREYFLINFIKPKILFFVPGHTLFEPKSIKKPWYFRAVSAYAFNIKGSPITLLITKRTLFWSDPGPGEFAHTIYGRSTWVEECDRWK